MTLSADSVALPLLILHTPPETESYKVMVVPTQSGATPVIMPAPGSGVTVMVVIAMPQGVV